MSEEIRLSGNYIVGVVTPQTVGESTANNAYQVEGFDKTIDLDTDNVYDLNGVIGMATDKWKVINGIMCRKFYHVKGAEHILAENDHEVMWFYLPAVAEQDHRAMGLFEKVTEENL